jgi:hypothetical protein
LLDLRNSIAWIALSKLARKLRKGTREMYSSICASAGGSSSTAIQFMTIEVKAFQ